jgi:hypothetical protein
MAFFLRDERVSNLTISPEAIANIADIFTTRLATMPEFLQSKEGEPPNAFFSYTIRADQKGYKLFDKEQLLHSFNQASDVERVIFELMSVESLRTNRAVGSFLELRLDKNENVPCFLTVSSDNVDWMNGTFSVIKEELNKHRNRHSLIRNTWVELLVKMAGVFFGFIVSLWGASKIAPNLTIENAFLISFLLVLFVFSNLWAPINKILREVVHRLFPIIRFYRPDKEKLSWLKQGVTAGIVLAGTLYVLGLAFRYVGRMLGTLVGK